MLLCDAIRTGMKYHEGMKKLTLILTLSLAAAAWGQSVTPPHGSQTTSVRPPIRADFDRRVDDPRIWVDGIEFTHYVRSDRDTVYLNPPYNLDYGTHQVQVITEDGHQANWNFDIVDSNYSNRYPYDNRYPANRYPRDTRYPDNRYPDDRYPANRYPYDYDDDTADLDVGDILPALLPYILREL